MQYSFLLRGLLFLLLSGITLGVSASEVEEGSFTSDGVTIRYKVEGEGEPLLLIHGYRASGDMNWRVVGVNRHLSQLDRYRIITIDNRGHGASDKPTDPAAYGRNMVLDQVRLLDHLGIEQAHVAGYSMGGMIALRMAVDFPERMRSVAICGMGWTRDDPATRDRFANGRRDPKTSDVAQAVYRSWGELGVSREDLLAIELPMIAIVGSEDGLYRSSVVPLREARPDIPLVLIDEGTHMNTLLKSDFHRAISDWLLSDPGESGASSE